MYHVELRQFPHQGRAFNLASAELEARILEPWRRGRVVEVQERRFSPERARLTIYEGRALEVAEIGLGRGWANVTRIGTDVTDAMLARTREQAGPRREELRRELLARAALAPLTLAEVLGVAAELDLTEDAAAVVWKLLDEGELRLSAG